MRSKNVFTYFYERADIRSETTAFSPPAPTKKLRLTQFFSL